MLAPGRRRGVESAATTSVRVELSKAVTARWPGCRQRGGRRPTPGCVPDKDTYCPDGSEGYLTGWRGSIDYPHNSMTPGADNVINTHVIGFCYFYPAAHSVSASTYRHHGFGCEHLLTKGDNGPKKKIRLNMAKSCSPGTYFRYRTSARFSALVNGRQASVSFSNQNPDEIRCNL